MFAEITQTPAVQAVARRSETGGVLSCSGLSAAAQPFFAVLLRQMLPDRTIVVVTQGLKDQELAHQDIATWLHFAAAESQGPKKPEPQPLFYPPWEVLPQDPGLPHVDVISERLETLVALTSAAAGPANAGPQLVVTSVAALLQRTLSKDYLQSHTRTVSRGDRINPLDLVEWLEDQGYEPEAQVNEKGEIALRGGILDIYPLTSPWPVRLDFFGDELESLRQFDPLTQKSLDEIPSITIPPGGELGLLRKARSNLESGQPGSTQDGQSERRDPTRLVPAGTLLEYFPAKPCSSCLSPSNSRTERTSSGRRSRKMILLKNGSPTGSNSSSRRWHAVWRCWP